ncbi:hypothetical protein F5880DRAFT_1683124 [Lentinula raphanica]|nr:hypothetical protein F5880DRAFT_1683124 [Lentinula raphanica]
MKRTLGAGIDKTTNKETGMGIAMDYERNPKKRKIVKEGVGADADAGGVGTLNVIKNEIRDGVARPASLKVEADTEGWTKVGKKSKKTKKEKKKIESQIPRFMYSNGDIVKRQHAVGVEEIRDLAIDLLVHEGRPPSFIRTEHIERIAKVVILLVPGITPDVLNINIEAGTLKNPNLPTTIPFAAGFIPNTFSHACPTRAPGDQSRMFSVLGTFLNMVRKGFQFGHKSEEEQGFVDALSIEIQNQNTEIATPVANPSAPRLLNKPQPAFKPHTRLPSRCPTPTSTLPPWHHTFFNRPRRYSPPSEGYYLFSSRAGRGCLGG